MPLFFALSVLVSGGGWTPLAPGVEYDPRRLVPSPAVGDGVLHIVRVDPKVARLRAHAASASGGPLQTAGDWAESLGAVAVINAGMYETDFSTHTGYFQVGFHRNNARWVSSYHSVLLIGGPPGAHIVDMGSRPAMPSSEPHAAVVQNLRLIASQGAGASLRGRNVWSNNGRQWSEAALAMDAKGRILLLFSRTPLMMSTFNELLLASDLGIVRAQHLEGGPEASLSIRGPSLRLDLCGSFETGFNEKNDNAHQWPLPNVLAVMGAKQ